MLNLLVNPAPAEINTLIKRVTANNSGQEADVNSIIEKVRTQGDDALRAFTEKFDKVKIGQLKVNQDEFDQAERNLSEDLRNAIQVAALNIETFHLSQQEHLKVIETTHGVKCWRKSVGIERVGLYIPGGSAPLFSTVLMLAIPARIAGCKEIICCTPPGADGKIHPAVLYSAKLAGVHQVFKVGGVQAIAAMAHGTESIDPVFKIFGPGNSWVTAAKQIVSSKGVAIDLPAGPSELAILADASANPDFIASDLLSQAEHGPDSQVVFVTNEEELIQKVLDSLKKQLDELPRKQIASQALSNSFIIRVNNMDDGLDLLNQYAPEHLIISSESQDELAEKVINAGSVFLGNYSPESAGDYASGTNHTLPTSGYARAYSGVSLDSFLKKITFQQISREGLKKIGPSIEIMAEAEGLQAHKNAVTLRLNS